MRKQEMQIDNLQKRSYDVNAIGLPTTYLVPSSVSYKHYERAMILLDIVIDQNRYARVELFAHAVDRDKKRQKFIDTMQQREPQTQERARKQSRRACSGPGRALRRRRSAIDAH